MRHSNGSPTVVREGAFSPFAFLVFFLLNFCRKHNDGQQRRSFAFEHTQSRSVWRGWREDLLPSAPFCSGTPYSCLGHWNRAHTSRPLFIRSLGSVAATTLRKFAFVCPAHKSHAHMHRTKLVQLKLNAFCSRRRRHTSLSFQVHSDSCFSFFALHSHRLSLVCVAQAVCTHALVCKMSNVNFH